MPWQLDPNFLAPIEARKTGAKLPRILIVDDDAGQRSLLDSFLRSQGFETVLAQSGQRALELLRAEQFSLMIPDVRMPGLSGLETLRRSRKYRSSSISPPLATI